MGGREGLQGHGGVRVTRRVQGRGSRAEEKCEKGKKRMKMEYIGELPW